VDQQILERGGVLVLAADADGLAALALRSLFTLIAKHDSSGMKSNCCDIKSTAGPSEATKVTGMQFPPGEPRFRRAEHGCNGAALLQAA
jgi:hypothetical protein